MEAGVGEGGMTKTTVRILFLGPRSPRSQVEQGTMGHVISTPGSGKTTVLLIKKIMQRTDDGHV